MIDDGGTWKVYQWADQSENGNNVAQATPANRPVWIDGQLNGFPVIDFDGSSQYLSMLSSWGSGVNEFTILVIAQPYGLTFGAGSHILMNVGTSAYKLGPNFYNDINLVYYSPGDDSNAYYPFTDETWNMFMFRFDVSGPTPSDRVQAFLNNAQQSLTITNDWNTALSLAWLDIGSFKGSSAFTQMRIAAIVAWFRALSAPERNKVLHHYSRKYDIALAA